MTELPSNWIKFHPITDMHAPHPSDVVEKTAYVPDNLALKKMYWRKIYRLFFAEMAKKNQSSVLVNNRHHPSPPQKKRVVGIFPI